MNLETLKLLILEDSESDKKLILDTLGKSGLSFNYIVVDNKEDFLERLLNYKPNIILTKFNLQKFDSKEALIIASKYLSTVPFIFVLSPKTEKLAIETLELRATDYVLKKNLGKLPITILKASVEAMINTEKEVFRKKLSESEKKIQNITNSIKEIFFALDINFNIIFWNRASERKFLISSNKVLGKNFFELSFFKKTIFKNLLLKVLETKKYQKKILGFSLHGDSGFAEFNIYPSNDGLSILIRDYTEQKNIEDKYRLIADNATDLICLHQINGKFSFISPSVKDILGYNPKNIINTSPINLFYEKDLIKFKRQLIFFKKNNFRAFTAEYRIIKKNGRHIWLEFSVSALFNKDRELQGFQSTSRNVNIRKKAEEKFRKAYQKEKELIDLKSRFVNITSHQFRTPLTSIQTNMDLINLRLKNGEFEIPDKIKKNLDRIEEEINRLTQLINYVLIIGKIQSGNVNVSKEPIDLVSLGNDLETKFNEIHLPAGRKLIFSVKNNPYPVSLDSKLIHIAVSNFITNAFKYSKNADPELTIIFKTELIQILIKDKGIGIPENELKLLFDPFFRAKNVGNIPGTGLGLTISKDFIELSGGIITVKSQVNKGTEVKITFYN